MSPDTSREQEQIRFIHRWKGGEDTFQTRQFSISHKRVERFKREVGAQLIPTPRSQ